MDVEVVHVGGRYGELIAENLRRRCPGSEVVQRTVPNDLPLVLDDPEEYLPAELGSGDVIIALHVHPDLLYEIPHAVSHRRARALIAPVEDPLWLQQGLIGQVTRACSRFGIESAFPKPFCSLEGLSPAIADFCETFGVGKPDFDVVVDGGVVTDVVFRRGSPCGCTEWAVRRLVGARVDEDLPHRAAEGLHAYPCLASMAMDPALGETIMHEAIALLERAAERATRSALEGGAR
jgi:hypothetical protein